MKKHQNHKKYWITTLLMICMLSADVQVPAQENIALTSEPTDAKYTSNTTTSDYITSQDEKWQYMIQENEAYVYRCLQVKENVEIPEKIDGYTVGGITGTLLFNNDYTTKTLSLPSTVHTLEAGAFATAYALETIEIDKYSIEGFHCKDGILYNGTDLFAYPPAKEGEIYVIPEGTTELLRGAFYGCSNLKKIVVPSSVRNINTSAFVRSKQPIDIVLKRESFFAGYIGRSCWEMAEGTRFLLKSEALKNEMVANETGLNGVLLEVADPIPATSLKFKDGSTEKHISINYTNTGKSNDSQNRYKIYDLYQQEPADTTDNVKWSLLHVDKTAVSKRDVCEVYNDGIIQTYSGGEAVLVGQDESGHKIILNVTIQGEVEREKEEEPDTSEAEEKNKEKQTTTKDGSEDTLSGNESPEENSSINHPPAQNITTNPPAEVSSSRNPMKEVVPIIQNITISRKKETIRISWKRDKTLDGYQIRYAKNKKFSKGRKTITVKKNRKTFHVLHQLSAKKKYYVCMRGYKTVEGKRYYGEWSQIVKIKPDKKSV